MKIYQCDVLIRRLIQRLAIRKLRDELGARRRESAGLKPVHRVRPLSKELLVPKSVLGRLIGAQLGEVEVSAPDRKRRQRPKVRSS